MLHKIAWVALTIILIASFYSVYKDYMAAAMVFILIDIVIAVGLIILSINTGKISKTHFIP